MNPKTCIVTLFNPFFHLEPITFLYQEVKKNQTIMISFNQDPVPHNCWT